MENLLKAIDDDDHATVKKLLRSDASLATCLVAKARLYKTHIYHWLYVGDTALHLAAAGYRIEIVNHLLKAGADPNAATNHRRSTPLHYAADGSINCPAWDEKRQLKTIGRLLEAGANINAQDQNGATPLHRAVRTRCAAAVKCLLDAKCHPILKNKPGSTPFHLAVQNTGRGGSGTDEAHEAQREIIETFLAKGISLTIKDGKNKSVKESARSEWIKALLSK